MGGQLDGALKFGFIHRHGLKRTRGLIATTEITQASPKSMATIKLILLLTIRFPLYIFRIIII